MNHMPQAGRRRKTKRLAAARSLSVIVAQAAIHNVGQVNGDVMTFYEIISFGVGRPGSDRICRF